MGITLKAKVLLSIGLTIFLLLTTSTLIQISSFQKSYLEAIQWRSVSLAQSLSADISERYKFLEEFSDTQLLLETSYLECKKIYEANRSRHVAFVAVIDEAGVIIAHNDKALWHEPVDSDELLKALQRREVQTILQGENYHTLIPITAESGAKLGTIDIGFPKSVVSEKIMATARYASLIYFLFMLIASFLVWLSVNHFVSQPINRLVETTSAIADGNLDEQFDILGSSEFKILSTSIKNMREAIRENIGNLNKNNQTLNQEIVRRKEIEVELEKHHENLEKLVEERTAALSESNKELEAFSYSISHDLRAPLRAITGFSEIIQAEEQNLAPELQRYLQKISSNARQMGLLIDDLLNLSRLNRKELKKEKVNMTVLFREVANSLMAERSKQSIEFNLAGLPPCKGDTVLLRQVVANLLENAFKYSQGRDKTIVDVGKYSDGEQDVYFVRDNGVGFNMQYADKLFGVFQRLHKSEDFEGTGIGLALTKRIIDRHGGRIWAEAEVDKGATFLFTLKEVQNTA